MPTKLKKLAIDRIDLVDDGACQHAHVMLFKRTTPTEEETMSQEQLDSITKRLTDIEKANGTLTADLATSNTELAKRDTVIADLTKSLQATEDARKASDAVVQKMRDDTAVTESVAMAKSLGLPADKAPMLKTAKVALTPEDYAALIDTFKAQKSAVDEALGVVKGASSGEAPAGEGSASVEVGKRADALVAAKPSLSRDEAIAEVVTSDPALYDRQQREIDKIARNR